MHVGLVTDWQNPPKYTEVEAPPLPAPDSGLVQIKVIAAGVHRVVRQRAAGKHSSAGTLPFHPGSDGVGTTADGKVVYFSTFFGGGSFSEVVNVPKTSITPLPAGTDPIQAAALVNPALSSWMALKTRTTDLPEKFSVLIMGATSASGAIAISLARQLGAGKVIGCARNAAALSKLDLDESVVLRDSIEDTDFSHLSDVDVILDYLYGPPTLHLLKTLKVTRPVQYVQIGNLASLTMDLPGDILRSRNLTIRGSAPGSFGMADMARELPKLLDAVVSVPKQHLKQVKLRDIEQAWDQEGSDRVVIIL